VVDFDALSTAIATDAVHEVVVVGDRTFGDVPPGLREKLLQLARAAATHLLSVTFDSAWRLVGADPRPPLDAPQVIDALKSDLLMLRAAC
jgi:hypothetical protein